MVRFITQGSFFIICKTHMRLNIFNLKIFGTVVHCMTVSFHFASFWNAPPLPPGHKVFASVSYEWGRGLTLTGGRFHRASALILFFGEILFILYFLKQTLHRFVCDRLSHQRFDNKLGCYFFGFLQFMANAISFIFEIFLPAKIDIQFWTLWVLYIFPNCDGPKLPKK